MNAISLNATSETVVALDLAREIIANYGTRGISGFGLLVNLVGLLVLRNKRLEEKFYDFLFCRCFCNLIVCLFGSFYNRPACPKCPTNYILACVQIFLYQPWSGIALLASLISDVLLIFSRLLFVFDKRTNVFFELSIKFEFIPLKV